MKKFALALVLVASPVNADPPHCPYPSWNTQAVAIRSGTEFCALENREKNFPEVAGCTSAQERFALLCPDERIALEWKVEKRDTIRALISLNHQLQDSEKKDEAVRKKWQRMIAFISRDLGSTLNRHIQDWERRNHGKAAITQQAIDEAKVYRDEFERIAQEYSK